MRTQVGIVGAGPAGLLLAHILDKNGIDSVVLEQRDRAYVEARVRAGVLEPGTIDLVHDAGIGARMAREGLVHTGFDIALNGDRRRVDLARLTGGKAVTVYGQTELMKDLIQARLESGAPILFEAKDVRPRDFDGAEPAISFEHPGSRRELRCDFRRADLLPARARLCPVQHVLDLCLTQLPPMRAR